MKASRRGGSKLAAPVAVALLIGLPLLYVLSIGPAVWVYYHAGFSDSTNDVIEAIYMPLIVFCEAFDPLGEYLQAYIDLWE